MTQSAFRGPDSYTSYSANEQLSCAITATLAAEQLNNFIYSVQHHAGAALPCPAAGAGLGLH